MPRYKVPGVRKGVTPPSDAVVSDTFDNRFGTDTVTAASTGWFTFGLHPGNRRVWVDSSGGNDANSGLSAALAKATFDAAWAAFKSGWTSGDQLMIAGTGSRSYTTTGQGNAAGLGGISATYPTVIMCYDPASPADSTKYGKLLGADLPVIALEADSNNNPFSMGSSNPVFGPSGNFFLQGLELKSQNYAASRTAIGFTGSHNNVGIQNCKLNGVAAGLDAGGSGSHAQISNFSKNAHWGMWNSSDGNQSGLYIGDADYCWIQDSVFVRPGLKLGAAYTDAIASGGPSYLSHAIYYHATGLNARFDRLICIDAGGDAFSMRGDVDATCLTAIDCPSPGSISSYSISYTERPGGSLVRVTDTVVMGSVQSTNLGGYGGNGWNSRNGRDGTYLKNTALFDNPIFGIGTYSFNYDNLDASSSTYCLFDNIRDYQYGDDATSTGHGGHDSGVHVDVTNSILNSAVNSPATSTNNSTYTGLTYPNKKTRAEVYGAMGYTANTTTGKTELVNWLLEYPQLAGQVAKVINTIGLQSLGLSPITYTATTTMPSTSGLTAPRSIY